MMTVDDLSTWTVFVYILKTENDVTINIQGSYSVSPLISSH